MADRRAALIVATDTYDDSTLRKLQAPREDADHLARILSDEELGDFSVKVLQNEPHNVVAEAIDEILYDAARGDVVVLHFSCHGLKNQWGELFLAARDTRIDRLPSTAIAANWVSTLMQKSYAKQIVLLLDCCFGGAFARGLVHRGTDTVTTRDYFDNLASSSGSGKGRIVITASGATEYALDGDRVAEDRLSSNSVFTGALIAGIETGAADRDRDGRVSVQELYDYVHDEVVNRASTQTPEITTYGQRGNVFISRSPFVRIEPDPLPDNLTNICATGTPYEKQAAVFELRELAEREDLPVAAAGFEALNRLVTDDSRRVSSLAQQQVEELTPTFGEPVATVTEDGGAIAIEVPVDGVPLARVGSVASPPPGLRGSLRDGRLRVRVERSAAVPADLEVTVTTQLGTFTVPLRLAAEVTPQPEPPAASAEPVAEQTPPVSTPRPALILAAWHESDTAKGEAALRVRIDGSEHRIAARSRGRNTLTLDDAVVARPYGYLASTYLLPVHHGDRDHEIRVELARRGSTFDYFYEFTRVSVDGQATELDGSPGGQA